jgi:hypothetical protein
MSAIAATTPRIRAGSAAAVAKTLLPRRRKIHSFCRLQVDQKTPPRLEAARTAEVECATPSRVIMLALLAC